MDPAGSGEKRDWRLQTTATLAQDWTSPWTGQTVKAGVALTVVTVMDLPNNVQLTVNLPNATALFFNIAHRSYSQARGILERHGLLDKGARRRDASMPEEDGFLYIELMARCRGGSAYRD